MYQPQSSGKGIIVFIFLVILLVISFIIWGDKIIYTQKLHNSLFSKLDIITSEKVTENLVLPPTENDWCKIQTIQVGDTREDPTADRIIGWNDIEKCCVRSIEGFNCALHTYSKVNYCFTGHIGGEIKYVTIDGYYGDLNKYKIYIEHQDKEQIPNKPCNNSIYPEVLK